MHRQRHFVRLSAAALCIAGAGMVFASGEPTAVIDSVKIAAAARQQPRGKVSSGVVVRHSVPDKIAVGETVTLRLQFSGVTAVDGATVEVRDPSTRDMLVSLWLARGELRTIELPYISRTDGMQFIDITTAQAGRNSVQSLPLRVGSGELTLKPEGKRQTTTKGEDVISLPAIEPAVRR